MGKASGSAGKPHMTRRVLLTAGGLTVLGLWASENGREASSAAASGHPAPDARPGPTASSSASGRPALTGSGSASHPPASYGQALPPPASSSQASSSQASSSQVSRAQASRSGASAAESGSRTAPPGTRAATSSPTGRASTSRPAAARSAASRSDKKLAAGGQGSAAGRSPMFYLDDGPKAIALTIDDGPSPVYTPQVLQLLARYGITATFSMVGLQVRANPALAREVAQAGHLIANHTWSHLDLTKVSASTVSQQMSRGTDAIQSATGRRPDLFRAPYGAWSSYVLAQCADAGQTPLGWSVDPRDWSRPGTSSIIANIMRNTRAGSIILEHDGGGNRSQTVAALKTVIPRLLDAGYQFGTP